MFERIAAGRTDLVFDLVRNGAAATAPGPDGVPPIRWCAYYGDVSALRFLLAQGESIDALGPNLDLNGAAFHGHWQLCEYLIEQGADPNLPLAETGESPLHAAITKAGRPAQERVLAVLLRARARPDVHTIPDVETGGFMRDARTRGETPLHRAAAFGSEAEVKLLLDAGARIDARDAHGESPLGWASWHLRPPSILRLLCFDGHSIHPKADWTGDHGAGRSGLEIALLGTPRA